MYTNIMGAKVKNLLVDQLVCSLSVSLNMHGHVKDKIYICICSVVDFILLPEICSDTHRCPTLQRLYKVKTIAGHLIDYSCSLPVQIAYFVAF